jgi:hypothetical protein
MADEPVAFTPKAADMTHTAAHNLFAIFLVPLIMFAAQSRLRYAAEAARL